MMKCCSCTTSSPSKIMNAWWLLKIAYGGLFIVAGVDKFFNMIALWSKYLSPTILQHITIDPTMLLQGIGIFEVLLGVVILSYATRIGAHVAAIWLLIVAANLLTMGYPYDVAVRDIIMAIGACALGCLSASKNEEIIIHQHGHPHNRAPQNDIVLPHDHLHDRSRRD